MDNNLKLTKTEIRQLSRGHIPERLENLPFCVLHYKERILFGTEYNWTWSVDISGEEDAENPIDRQTAMLIIRNNGMTEAYRSVEGQVYEMPGLPFKQEHATNKTTNTNKTWKGLFTKSRVASRQRC